MARNISLAGLQSLMAQETDHSWHCAISISGPGMTTVRAVQNTVDVVYGAFTYLACPFELTLAQDSEDSVPQATIRVDNVSRDLVSAIRLATESPNIDLEVFRIDAAGTVTREVGPMRFSLLSTKADAMVIEATLGYLTDFLNESAVKDRFVPSIAWALFHSAPSGVKLTVLPPSPTTADTVTLQAAVYGKSPTGTVVFKDGAATLGTVALVSSGATLTTTFSAGTHALKAEYSGDSQNPASTASVNVTVT